jgi:hypothetical protein
MLSAGGIKARVVSHTPVRECGYRGWESPFRGRDGAARSLHDVSGQMSAIRCPGCFKRTREDVRCLGNKGLSDATFSR